MKYPRNTEKRVLDSSRHGVLLYLQKCLLLVVIFMSTTVGVAAGLCTCDGQSKLQAAIANAAATPRPRILKGNAAYADILAAISAERAPGFAAMTERLTRQRASRIAGEDVTLAYFQATTPAARLERWWPYERELEAMAEAAFAWYVTHDAQWLGDVRLLSTRVAARLQQYGCVDDALFARGHVWYVAQAFDFASAGLDSITREQMKAIVRSCAIRLKTLPAEVTASPYNGVAFHSLGNLVASLALMVGEIPEADGWLADALPVYMAHLSPWGDTDGGYANGTSYALWDVGESLQKWDVIERVLGVPVYDRPWVAALPRFFAYTLPPGTPAGLFGDGSEVVRSEEWPRFGKSIAARYNTPLARWYGHQLQGGDSGRLHALLSPRVIDDTATLPAETENAAYFPSVGWVAMHSSLQNRDRTSVHFKSSPFGSFNHSHADQNSIVLFHRGAVVLAGSGYYDYYDSPHWRNWYKHTKANNAVTYDGGIGQSLGSDGGGSLTSSGRILNFEKGLDWTFATGDARTAYGGILNRALRSVVFLEDRFVLIMDSLDASVPRRYEWNFHSPLTATANGKNIQLTQGVCMQVLSNVAVSQRLATEVYPPPVMNGWSPGWHGVVTLDTAARQATFVAVIDLACNGAVTNLPIRVGEGWEISTATNKVRFSDADVGVTITRLANP